MAKMEIDNSTCLKGCGKFKATKVLVHCWWTHKLMKPLREAVQCYPSELDIHVSSYIISPSGMSTP